MSNIVRERSVISDSIRAKLIADIFHDRKSSIFCLVQWTDRQLDYLGNIVSNAEIKALKKTSRSERWERLLDLLQSKNHVALVYLWDLLLSHDIFVQLSAELRTELEKRTQLYLKQTLNLRCLSGDARRELARIWLNEIDYALAPYDGVLDVLGLAVEGFHDAQALLGRRTGASSDQHKHGDVCTDTWSEMEHLSTAVVSGVSALKARFEKEVERRQTSEAQLEKLNARTFELERVCAEKDAELKTLRDDRARLLESIAGINQTSNCVLAAVNGLSERCDRQTGQLAELTRQNAVLVDVVEQCRGSEDGKDAKSRAKQCRCCKVGKKWVI